MKSFLVSKAVQEQQKINANFKHYLWAEEQNSADQNKPSFLFVLMERGEIDLETIVKNLKDSKSFTPSKGQLISECIFQKNKAKIWQISALESKNWWNQQNKGTFL